MSDTQSSNPIEILGTKHRSLALFLVSVLGLFLEILLIRWIGTEIRIFAYLQNTILIVCFLGLGLGCFTCRREIQIRRTLLPLLCLTGLLAVPATRGVLSQISTMLSVMDDLLIWENGYALGAWQQVSLVALGLLLTLMLMLLVCETFIPLGRLLGRLMDDHPQTVWAYSINVAGSLIGIWLFVLLSSLSASPVIWFVIAAAMLVVFAGRGRERWINFGLTSGIVLAAWLAGRYPDALQVTWSPYQKLVLSENRGQLDEWQGKYVITVNNVGYQGIADLSEAAVRANPRIPRDNAVSQYDIPLLFKPRPQNVLIVGAGSGNDAAGALRGEASHVTAVEIDPAIIKMGRRFHPEHPYDSPRVTVANDDARAFFSSSKERFDLIIFGLLDSHTMTAMTNARLDHYVYTRESIARARSLLSDDGIMVLTFMAHRDYIKDRIAGCLRDVFGRQPLAFTIPSTVLGWGGTMFVTGNETTIQTALSRNESLAKQIAVWQQDRPVQMGGTAEVASDDWPYIYLERRNIPTVYFLMGGLMVALVLHYRKKFRIWSVAGLRQNWQKSPLHFFFLGAAFLLLEVQNISKASVVLGNTWVVNAIIISGILLMILLANMIAARFPRLPQVWLGGCLIASCLALYCLDLSSLGYLSYAPKAGLVGLLTTIPMFFAGILFIQSFARAKRKDEALGANLLGALVGGLLETITFIIGIKALLLLVAGLYLAALLTRPQGSGQQGGDDATDGESTTPITTSTTQATEAQTAISA